MTVDDLLRKFCVIFHRTALFRVNSVESNAAGPTLSATERNPVILVLCLLRVIRKVVREHPSGAVKCDRSAKTRQFPIVSPSPRRWET